MKLRGFLIAVLLVCLPSATFAQETLTEEKKADIAKVLEMTGALKMVEQMTNFMITSITGSLRRANPSLPEQAVSIVNEETKAAFSERLSGEGGFIEMMYPVYNKHFTHEDIKQLIQFYSSPLGKKLIETSPALMQDSMQAGTQWGAGIGASIEQKVMDRLKAEGIL
jgi:uncharacterized protein